MPKPDLLPYYLSTTLHRCSDGAVLAGAGAIPLPRPLLVVSAQNSGSRQQDPVANATAHSALGRALAQDPTIVDLTEIQATGAGDPWVEMSWALRDTPEAFARVVAHCHAYHQDGFFRLTEESVRVHWTDGGAPGTLHGEGPRRRD